MVADALDSASEMGAISDLQKLDVQVTELRAAITRSNSQLSEQCSIAAHEEAKIVEGRLTSELTSAREKGQVLQAATLTRERELAAKGAQLNEAEACLAEIEEHEQRLRQQEEKRKHHQVRLRKLEADHRIQMDRLQSDIRRTHERSNEVASQLRRNIVNAKQETEHLAAQNNTAEEVGAEADVLRSELGACRQKLGTLEASVSSMRCAASEKESEVCDLLEESGRLELAAEEKDEDAESLSELASCDDRVRDIAKRTAQLRQVDYTVASLEAQLCTSSHLIRDMETAIANAQTQVNALDAPEVPPASWAEDREHLRAQLVAMHQADQQAEEHAAKLEKELRELHARYSMAKLGPTPAAPSQSADALTSRIEHLEAELEEDQVSEVQAATHVARAALDAKGRRLRLLTWRCQQHQWQQQTGDVAQLEASLAACEQRAADLEGRVATLGSQHDAADLELRQLKRQQEERIQASREREELHDQLLSAQTERIASLEAAFVARGWQ